MQHKKVKVGVIGCGTICRRTYMDNMVNKFNIIDVVDSFEFQDNELFKEFYILNGKFLLFSLSILKHYVSLLGEAVLAERKRSRAPEKPNRFFGKEEKPLEKARVH